MKRRLAVACLWSLVALTLSGCFLKKKKPVDDDEPSATSTPTVTVGGTGAKNEKDVLRYANETPVSDIAAVIGKDGTKAKTFPASGGDVATLNKGAVVVQKAKFFSTGILVLFDDPTTNDGTKLLGWIAPSALDVTAPKPTVTSTAVPVIKPVAVDAGVKPVDAGVAVVVPLPAGALVAQPNAQTKLCPAGMTLFTNQNLCRRPCVTDAQCPSGTFCTNGAGPKKSCAATR